eukprot:scaffold4357_cov113-Isochrysis_galbana.AAC.21
MKCPKNTRRIAGDGWSERRVKAAEYGSSQLLGRTQWEHRRSIQWPQIGGDGEGTVERWQCSAAQVLRRHRQSEHIQNRRSALKPEGASQLPTTRACLRLGFASLCISAVRPSEARRQSTYVASRRHCAKLDARLSSAPSTSEQMAKAACNPPPAG